LVCRPAENQVLAAAVTRYAMAANPLAIEPFAEFLKQEPSSVWRASLQANLGGLHRASGYYTRALRAWDEAWMLSKDDRSPAGRAIADFTAGRGSTCSHRWDRSPGWTSGCSARKTAR